jgi:hypothetical protein
LTTDNLTDEGRAWVALHDAVLEAVRLITPKELCFRLGITAQYLTEALHNLNRKGFRLEWLPTVILMAPIDAVAPIVRALAELRGFTVERKKQLTAAEELVATRDVLKRVAPGVLSLVDQELGK